MREKDKNDIFSLEEKIEINKEIQRCGCSCHHSETIHMIDCCRATYMKPFKIEEKRISKITNYKDVQNLFKKFEDEKKSKVIKSQKTLIEEAHLCLDAAEFLLDNLLKQGCKK